MCGVVYLAMPFPKLLACCCSVTLAVIQHCLEVRRHNVAPYTHLLVDLRDWRGLRARLWRKDAINYIETNWQLGRFLLVMIANLGDDKEGIAVQTKELSKLGTCVHSVPLILGRASFLGKAEMHKPERAHRPGMRWLASNPGDRRQGTSARGLPKVPRLATSHRAALREQIWDDAAIWAPSEPVRRHTRNCGSSTASISMCAGDRGFIVQYGVVLLPSLAGPAPGLISSTYSIHATV